MISAIYAHGTVSSDSDFVVTFSVSPRPPSLWFPRRHAYINNSAFCLPNIPPGSAFAFACENLLNHMSWITLPDVPLPEVPLCNVYANIYISYIRG